MEFGKSVKSIRKRRGWTQAWCAWMVGVAPNSWARWENGESMPTIRMAKNIADVLGVTLSELLDQKVPVVVGFPVELQENRGCPS